MRDESVTKIFAPIFEVKILDLCPISRLQRVLLTNICFTVNYLVIFKKLAKKRSQGIELTLFMHIVPTRIMIPRNINDFDTVAGHAQNLLNNFMVQARPEELSFHRPKINDISDQIESFDINAFE